MSEEDRVKSDKYKSEFPLYSDFERISSLLRDADKISVDLFKTVNPKRVREYYSILKAIFRVIQPILAETKIVIELRNELKRLDLITFKVYNDSRDMGREYKVNYSLFQELEAVHSSLLQLKQDSGLGIFLKRSFTEKEKLSMAGGITDAND